MYGIFYNPKIINFQISDFSQHTQETFKAFVDAIIPRSPKLAEKYGKIQYFGALDLHTDEYMILSLNSHYIPLAKPVAEVLDIVSEQLVILDRNSSMYPEGGTFAALIPSDRFRALMLLEQNKDYFIDLLTPSQYYPAYLFSVISNLNRFTMMGYYSEWSGYGSTRLNAPDQRKLEFFPLSWKQVGYPGPSLGYRSLRNP
ncbi:hypothetical protein [Clostridium aminobutyricum]|uniref:Uncharacterized protein n=1 Tax=Clostridium aminobutyricum TaxID=33953 RepID=A0A939IGT2_CLOAM|nr:hypothetical protein [Clostridium aminobutyricum]MBN7772467.1 hypothetical protein [Clostridium aminobutyricum]